MCGRTQAPATGQFSAPVSQQVKEGEVQVVVVGDSVILLMSKDVASTIRSISGSVLGREDTSYRNHTNAVYYALREVANGGHRFDGSIQAGLFR